VVCTVGAEGNKRCRQLRDQVIQDAAYNPESLFKLLLNTSQYEFNLKEVGILSSSLILCTFLLLLTDACILFSILYQHFFIQVYILITIV